MILVYLQTPRARNKYMLYKYMLSIQHISICCVDKAPLVNYLHNWSAGRNFCIMKNYLSLGRAKLNICIEVHILFFFFDRENYFTFWSVIIITDNGIIGWGQAVDTLKMFILTNYRVLLPLHVGRWLTLRTLWTPGAKNML